MKRESKEQVNSLLTGYHRSDKVVEEPTREHLKPFSKCGFDESSYYYVWISFRNGNPPFKAVIYTGFNAGSYRAAFCGGESFKFDDRAKFRIITKIGDQGY